MPMSQSQRTAGGQWPSGNYIDRNEENRSRLGAFSPLAPGAGRRRRSAGLPRRAERLPRRAERLPRRAERLPRRAGGLPRRAERLPSRAGGLPSRAGGLPSRAGGLPRRAGGLPSRAGWGLYGPAEERFAGSRLISRRGRFRAGAARVIGPDAKNFFRSCPHVIQVPRGQSPILIAVKVETCDARETRCVPDRVARRLP
jgi:hypothetical protein